VDTGQGVEKVETGQADRIGNSPFMAPSKVSDPKPGDVTLIGISEAVYPPGMLAGMGGGTTYALFRLVAPDIGPGGEVKGYWILGIDARAARDVLSLYISPKSPLAAFSRTAEKRYSFFFDVQGWMLFQSGNHEDRAQPLSTGDARSGIAGDHGMPGMPGAFRPASANEAYWLMVVDIQAGKVGIETVSAELDFSVNPMRSYSLGYAPVFFHGIRDKAPEVVGGVAFMDRSRVLLAADYSFFDVLFVIFIAAMAVSSAIVYVLSRVITRPMQMLAEEVLTMPQEGGLRRIEAPCRDKETATLKDSINQLVDAVLSQREELRVKDAHLKDHMRRQPLDLGGKLETRQVPETVEGVIGTSPAMRDLKWMIRKAASVDPDVLIIGETGTGKEVTAQAIHKLSRRSEGPFISINCGALDENLLLDALFGHVKGAFSEAKTDRKGAFLAAHGGTILLDEIGNASFKVQQALLRTLAERTVIPLGSDEEYPFDARVIAATNVDLLECVENGTFREDLYYRLKVLTLHTPPLRERMEDIPLLADAFLKESAKVMNKPPATLSRGAWEKIVSHDWPGNVRELKHCIMRAVAMADTSTLYVEDLRFDTAPPQREPEQRTPSLAAPPAKGWPAPKAGNPEEAFEADAPEERDARPLAAGEGELNERQRVGLAYLREHGAMSRAQYQSIVGRNVPPRTAQYDLRDMVERGLLKVRGKGPATRYVLSVEPGRREG